MKLIIVAFAALSYVGFARADSNATYTVTASVPSSCGPITSYCAVPATISAQFTTTLETGEFNDTVDGVGIFGTEPVVTGTAGLFDGIYPITFSPENLVPTPGFGMNGWFAAGAEPQNVWFLADGINFDVNFGGNEVQIFCQGCGGVNGEILDWNATITEPEPSTFLTSALGLLLVPALALVTKRRRSQNHNAA